MSNGRQLPKIISKKQAEVLLAVPNVKCPTGLRNRVVMQAMYGAGLRVGEIIKLKPGHIRWQRGEIEVVNGKGGADRVVPVTWETMDWLQRWDQQRPKKGGRFFTTLKGKPLNRIYLYQMIRRCAAKTGLEFERIGCHVLRHTYATEKLDEGFTIREVQELLGHSSITTTQIYTHVSPQGLRAKVQGEAEKRNKLAEQIAVLKEQLAALEEAADW